MIFRDGSAGKTSSKTRCHIVSMDQAEFESAILRIVLVGIIMAVLEFIVIGVVIGRGGLVGLHNALLASGAVVILTVIVVWMTTMRIRPKQSEA